EKIDQVELFIRNASLPQGTFIAVSGAPLLGEAGEIRGGVVVFRDVTERKRLLDEIREKSAALEEQNRRVQEANRLKSEFLANMSPAPRTPLNAIIGFAELMHDGKVGEVAENHKEFLGDILSSSRHLLHLINDLLDLAKIESGRIDLRPEAVSVDALVADV